MYLNKIMLIGNVGATVRTTKVNNSTVTNFSVATSHGIKREDEWENITTWHNIVAWNLSSYILDNLQTGVRVYVEGRLMKRQYETESGEKKEAVEVFAEKVIVFNNHKMVIADKEDDEENRVYYRKDDVQEDIPF